MMANGVTKPSTPCTQKVQGEARRVQRGHVDLRSCGRRHVAHQHTGRSLVWNGYGVWCPLMPSAAASDVFFLRDTRRLSMSFVDYYERGTTLDQQLGPVTRH